MNISMRVVLLFLLLLTVAAIACIFLVFTCDLSGPLKALGVTAIMAVWLHTFLENHNHHWP